MPTGDDNDALRRAPRETTVGDLCVRLTDAESTVRELRSALSSSAQVSEMALGRLQRAEVTIEAFREALPILEHESPMLHGILKGLLDEYDRNRPS